MVYRPYNINTRRKSGGKSRFEILKGGRLVTDSTIHKILLSLHLFNASLDFECLSAMRDSLQNFAVDDILCRKLFIHFHGSFFCFHLINFLVKFGYLRLVVRNLSVEDLLLVEMLILLGFKVTKFFLTCFTKLPLKPLFVELRLDLEVII